MADWYRFAFAIVLLHLAVLGVHSAAHLALSIVPRALDLIFILAVIFVLPVASVSFLRREPRAAWVLSAAFAASLVYGAISHFVVAGPDNAVGLPSGPWAATFQGTTIALAAVEGLGILAGLVLGIRSRTLSAPVAPPA